MNPYAPPKTKESRNPELEDDEEEYSQSIRVSRALLIVFLIHLLAILFIFISSLVKKSFAAVGTGSMSAAVAMIHLRYACQKIYL